MIPVDAISSQQLMSSSISSIEQLPSIGRVQRAAQGLALWDAIMAPDWEYRYFSFNANWNGHHDEMMASMRDGEGAEYFLHFTRDGVAGKVLSGTGSRDAAKLLDAVPDRFRSFKDEPAFSNEEATLFFWRQVEAESWHASSDALTEFPLLGYLSCSVDTYVRFGESYYERKIDRCLVARVFETLRLTPEQLASLNPEICLDDLSGDLGEILGFAPQ